MASMFSYSKAAVERAMKIQEVLLRAMARKITWWQAAEILGFSDRHLRRIRERYQEFGYESMFDRRRGQPSPKRVPFATVEKVLALYRDKYFDLNLRHFHEKLREQHQIHLSYTWVKSVLQGAGLVAPQRQRGVHRKRRPRCPLSGMLLHIDGSHHQWFQDERWYDLIVILDDATSEILEAWQRSDLTDVTAKVVIYEAFVEGKLEAPKHLARTVHDLYFEPRYEEFRPRTIWNLSNAFTSAFKELDPIPQFKATAKLGEFLERRLSQAF